MVDYDGRGRSKGEGNWDARMGLTHQTRNPPTHVSVYRGNAESSDAGGSAPLRSVVLSVSYGPALATEDTATDLGFLRSREDVLASHSSRGQVAAFNIQSQGGEM